MSAATTSEAAPPVPNARAGREMLREEMAIARKYMGKGLLLAFPYRTDAATRSWYVVPHDELVEIAREQTTALSSHDWKQRGAYSWPRPSQALLRALQPYRVR